ncbi:SH3 domain-containing protein [Roseburia inulinivorans]
MKHKNLTLMAVAMSIVLSLSACGTAGKANSTAGTESVMTESTESVENSTEAFVPEEELSSEESVDETEATESVAETVTETQEPVADEAVINVKTVSEDKTANAGYTYSDLSKTMYAKNTVNVRSLPSTSGNKLGSLSKNQEVAVTGQCNETGWYRISFNNGEGFVSNKYLADEPVAKAASTKTAQAQTGAKAKTTSSSSTGDPVTDAAIAKYGPNIMIFEDGTIYSTETWQQVGTVDGTGAVADYTKPAEPVKPADGFDKGMAQQVWAYVNAEREAAGLNALAWSEDIYNFACTRAQAIVTDFSHSGKPDYYGENILINYDGTAESIQNQWKNSPVHYENYMKSAYTTGACAIYVYNGSYYAVENFSRTSSPQTDYNAQQTREVNGETLNLSGQQAEAFDNGNTWTASNGVVIYIQSNGNMSCNAVGDAATAAINEYFDTH